MCRLAIGLVVSASASWCAAGFWTENFTGANGTQPAGWSFTTAGGSTMDIQSNTLYMNSPQAGNPPDGANSEAWGYPQKASFPVLNSWDQKLPYTVQFDFKIPDTNNHWFFVYVDPSVHTVIDYNDDFTYRVGGINTKIMDLNTNQWYTMRYEVMASAGVYEIYVDNVLKATPAIDPNTIFTPFWIGDRHSNMDDYGSAYWDNFKIATNVPEPATLTLLALGGLGILARRRARR